MTYQRIRILAGLVLGSLPVFAQPKIIPLSEGLALTIQHSPQLKSAQDKINLALNKLKQAEEATLPSLSVSGGYSHALMLTRTLYLPGSENPLTLPFDNTLYQAGISVAQPILAGNRFRYARESASILVSASKTDAEKNQQDLANQYVQAYVNYVKIIQSQQVIQRSIEDVSHKLTEIRQFEAQGLATQNDVLSFELQQSNLQLNALDLETNRSIVRFGLNILMGLADSTEWVPAALPASLPAVKSLSDYWQDASANRREFASLQWNNQLADVNLKKVKDETRPTLAVTGNFYYINPTTRLLPKSNTFLAPFLIGLNASWDVSTLFHHQTHLAEARLQKQSLVNHQLALKDQVTTEVNQAYQKYQSASRKLELLQTAVRKAEENERITEVKFKNNLATTTERIDAETLLINARTQLQIARSEAMGYYYQLLYASGNIQSLL